MAKSDTPPGLISFRSRDPSTFLMDAALPTGVLAGDHPTERSAGAIQPSARLRGIDDSAVCHIRRPRCGVGATNSSERGLTPM